MGRIDATELILCALTAGASGTGLLLHSRRPDGTHRRDMYVYYTNLSNLLVCIYYAMLFLTGVVARQTVGMVLRGSVLQMVMACCIWITHLVFAFILWPAAKRAGKKMISFADTGRFVSNLLVHYIAPLLALAEWAVCADKNGLNFFSPLWCLVLPFAYFAYVMIRGGRGVNIDGTSSPYPYFFIDAKRLTAAQMVRNVVMLLAVFTALGFVMAAVGKAL